MSFSEWREVELEEVIELVIDYRGKTPKKLGGDWSQVGYRALSAKNIKTGRIVQEDAIRYLDSNLYTKWMKEEVNRGDILMTSEAPFGELLYWDSDEKIVLSQRLFCLRTNKKVDSKYLYYYMTTNRFQKELDARATGTTVRGLRQPQLLKCKIEYPPIKDQEAIANILSSMDEKIRVNNQINKTLENMAQAIFKQWFVDFEFPNEDGEPYKSSGGEMIESELGMIPKGWGVEEIGNISDIQNGFAFKAPEYVDEGVKVLRTLNIGNDGYFNNTDIVFLPQSYKSEKYEKYYFEEFDVALVMVGASIGKIGMILKNTAGGLQNQNMWRFRRKEKRVSQIFIYYTVKQAQNISKNWSTGSARDFYRKDSFRKIKVILPEKRIMDLFEKITKPIFQNISNHVCENDELISMRDGLLPKLMSGEIRVHLDEAGDAS